LYDRPLKFDNEKTYTDTYAQRINFQTSLSIRIRGVSKAETFTYANANPLKKQSVVAGTF
jgi:hypothetical protein